MSRDLEKFKSDIAKAAYEHQVRFSKLHEKQASAIADIYRWLRAIEDDFLRLRGVVDGSRRPFGTDEFHSLAADAEPFKLCFRDNRIYLDEPLCESIDAFVQLTDEGARTWFNSETPYDIEEILSGLCLRLTLIRKELEKRFRAILGGSDTCSYQ